MKYVIIGNSAGAVGCVEGIRQVDPEGPITIVSNEAHHTYSRPLISYLLGGKTDEKRMKYRPADFYKRNGCTALLGKEVKRIDPGNKTVSVDGKELPFDKLLVATGSSPFVPPIPGIEKVQHKHTFLTLDDARALDKQVDKNTKILILGAGLIGLKCAEGLAKRTPNITVVDLAEHVLPSILDDAGAELVQKNLRANGIRLILGESVGEFGAAKAVLSKSNEVVTFDLLVVAVGVRPNVALVSDAGGEVERGIVTDEYCRTTLPDVYAAGDCTESVDVSSGARKVLALLPNAYMQGECAGIHMAGGDKLYDKAIPMNAIGFFGQHILTAGTYAGEEYKVVGEGSYKRLFYQENRLVGYILIGAVERAGIYTSLIRERTPLDSVDFSLIKDKPQLMAFSRRERAKKLGGVGA